MVLQKGERLHIMARRLFEGDVRLHFVCEVDDVTETSFRASGYLFVLDKTNNRYERREDTRTRVFSLPDMGLIINVLPQEVDVAAVIYRTTGDGLVVTDDKTFTMDINEFGPMR